MSVASEITRLQGAKADLKTSIEAKGVTVPSATLISGYASLVDQISGGGGLPDSDGLLDLSIATGDMTASASTLTLTYTPTYLLRYAPSTPISSVSSMSISKTVTYPAVVWTCNNPSVTISGSTATITSGTDADVVFTATWSDYNGDTHTTSKTIHVMNMKPVLIDVTEWHASGVYFVTTQWPGSINVNHYETYQQGYYICYGDGGYNVGWNFKVLSQDGSTMAKFSTVDAAKAAIDML